MLWYLLSFHGDELEPHIYALSIYSVVMSLGFLILYLRRNKNRGL
jgi:hypothetical protein